MHLFICIDYSYINFIHLFLLHLFVYYYRVSQHLAGTCVMMMVRGGERFIFVCCCRAAAAFFYGHRTVIFITLFRMTWAQPGGARSILPPDWRRNWMTSAMTSRMTSAHVWASSIVIDDCDDVEQLVLGMLRDVMTW